MICGKEVRGTDMRGHVCGLEEGHNSEHMCSAWSVCHYSWSDPEPKTEQDMVQEAHHFATDE
jgi:hypothetical protein